MCIKKNKTTMLLLEYIISLGSLTFLAITLLAFLFYQFVYKYWSYFRVRGLKFVRGIPLLGSNYKLLMGKQALGPAYQRLYNKYPNEQMIGMYDVGGYPLYLLRDPELIKQVTIKNYEHFLNHRIDVGEKTDSLLANTLIFMKNQRWKEMRSTLSPAFTGSKIRLMFSLMTSCCSEFVRYLNVDSAELKQSSEIYEMKDIFSRFANDTIATCAFGVEVNSMKHKQNVFYRTGRSITKNSAIVLLKLFGIKTCPKIMNFFKLRIVSNSDAQYFRNVVNETIEYRRSNKVNRTDMVQLLMEASKGTLNYKDTNQKDQNVGFATAEESNVGRSTSKVKG